MNADPETELAAQRAAEWMLNLPTATSAQREAFMTWLRESPVHVREFLAGATWDKLLDHIDPERSIDVDALWTEARATSVALRAPSTSAGRRGVHRRSWPWAAAATVLIAIGAVSWWIQGNLPSADRYSTSFGEQRVIELDEGSTVHLNTRSQITVHMTDQARDLFLQEGQATFKVQRDPTRPFRVHVDNTVIEAVGTQFDVYRRASNHTTIAVLEGAVRVGGSTLLRAGESVTLKANERMDAPASVDPELVSAWQRRRLIFRNTPLAEVVEEFNRYNKSPKIRVEGTELRSKLIWAVCDADDPGSFVHSLADDSSIRVEKTAGEIVLAGQR